MAGVLGNPAWKCYLPLCLSTQRRGIILMVDQRRSFYFPLLLRNDHSLTRSRSHSAPEELESVVGSRGQEGETGGCWCRLCGHITSMGTAGCEASASLLSCVDVRHLTCGSPVCVAEDATVSRSVPLRVCHKGSLCSFMQAWAVCPFYMKWFFISKRKEDCFVPGIPRKLQFSNAIHCNPLIPVGNGDVAADSQRCIRFVGMGRLQYSLALTTIRSLFPSDEVAADWACTASWPQDCGTSVWGNHRDFFQIQKRCFKRSFHQKKWGNLFRCLKENCLGVLTRRRGRLLEWLEGGEVYASTRSGLTVTVAALQGWLRPSSHHLPLILEVRNPVLCSPVSPAPCATPKLMAHLSSSCSSVTVSILPVTATNCVVSAFRWRISSRSRWTLQLQSLSLCMFLRIPLQWDRKGKEAGFLLVESCLQCPSPASPAASLPLSQGPQTS